MAESSRFWTTGTTNDGATTYSADNFGQFVRESFMTNLAAEGVLYGILNALAVSGTSSPVAVASGAALVYGFYYSNTASVNVTIATPAALTRVDRIVLRVDWTNHTVRITRIAGTEGAGTPAMTQTANTTWDIPLATVSITTGGVITVTDARTFVKHPGVYGWLNGALTINDDLLVSKSESGGAVDVKTYNTSNTANSDARVIASVGGASGGDSMMIFENTGVTAWAIGLDNSDSDKFKISSGTALGTGDKLVVDSSGNLTVGGGIAVTSGITVGTNVVITGALSAAGGLNASELLSGTVPLARLSGITTSQLSASAGILDAQIAALDAAKITSGTLPAARLPTDSVDDTIVGNRVPALIRRQGGNASDWSVQGTTGYTPTNVRMQAGGSSTTGAVGLSGGVATITFPVAFSQPPLIFIQAGSAVASVGSPTASSFQVATYLSGGGNGVNTGFYWLAIGAE